jgi:hypothetical protein
MCRFLGCQSHPGTGGQQTCEGLAYIDRALTSIDRGRLLTRDANFIRLLEFLGGSRKGIRNGGSGIFEVPNDTKRAMHEATKGQPAVTSGGRGSCCVSQSRQVGENEGTTHAFEKFLFLFPRSARRTPAEWFS